MEVARAPHGPSVGRFGRCYGPRTPSIVTGRPYPHGNPASMPSLKDVASKKPLQALRKVRLAHFQETHYVYTGKGGWDAGAKGLRELFPRTTHPQRPAEWYAQIRSTHWPARVPPGNGPFYLPDWVVGWDGAAEEKRRAKILLSGGYKTTDVAALYLSQSSEYLVSVMRTAGEWAWNADPRLYVGYIYASLPSPGKAATLRAYNTERWRGG